MFARTTGKTALLAGAAAAMMGVASAGAQASTLVGLVDGRTLVWMDTQTKQVVKSVDLDCEVLIGMDVRPTTNTLYGITVNGNIVEINSSNGHATEKSKIGEKIKKDGDVIVKFNPTNDRLLILRSDGTNFSVNVDDGDVIPVKHLKYGKSDENSGKTPRIGLGAYGGNASGAAGLAFYNIDVANGALARQASIGDENLKTVGPLGIVLGTGYNSRGTYAFDIVQDANGGTSAWLMVESSLYSVDLATGRSTFEGDVSGVRGRINGLTVMQTK